MWPFSYNGSLTARGSDSFAWDYEERMVSATVNSVTTTFAYRGDGLRDSRTTGANTTTFTWDIAAGLPVVIDDGAQYVYGAGLEAQFSGANTYYYLADGLGSTMKTVDGSGNVVNSYTYDVYGKKTSSSGSQANEFDFAGQQTDPTGLQYLRARYMDPETGTFISREPMAIEHTWLGNPHSYGAAAPTTTTDPTGLEPRACARFNWCFHSSIDGIGPQHWWEWSPLRDTNVYRVCAFAGGQKWCSPADSLGFDQDSINGANWEQFVDMILAIASPGSGSSPGRHNYRKGLEDRTNFRPSTKEYHAHHVIPQKFREQLRATINIDDPRYLEWWDAPGHRANWKAYNNYWDEFFSGNLNATAGQILAEGRRIMGIFGKTVSY